MFYADIFTFFATPLWQVVIYKYCCVLPVPTCHTCEELTGCHTLLTTVTLTQECHMCSKASHLLRSVILALAQECHTCLGVSHLLRNVTLAQKCHTCSGVSHLLRNVKLAQKCHTCSEVSHLLRSVTLAHGCPTLDSSQLL